MPPLAVLDASDFLTAWTAWPPGILVLAVVVVPYLVWWRQAARRGARWPWWRSLLYLAAGAGTLAYCVCGPLQVERTSRFWVAALQVGILASVTPVGLALGDPVRLRALTRPGRHTGSPSGAAGVILRVLMFPVVSSFLAIGSLMAVFYSPYFEASMRSTLVEAVLVVHLLVTGLLFVLPLLVAELLPRWASPGVRALIAFGDGLLDAIPGIALMSTSSLLFPGFPAFASLGVDDALMDQRTGGGVLLGVSEMVGLPLIAAVLIEWVRSDDREARESDALADSIADSIANSVTVADAVEPATGLWWQSDPRFADRYRARGDRDG
ncbi:MAG: cytochrome c oxidase assembly protein [Actinomycetota bacterium]|nr:cytochrome c oxidase assembly protein [Actinomycetota bacterium]